MDTVIDRNKTDLISLGPLFWATNRDGIEISPHFLESDELRTKVLTILAITVILASALLILVILYHWKIWQDQAEARLRAAHVRTERVNVILKPEEY